MYRQNETELRRAMDRLERWFGAHVDADFFREGTPAADGPLALVLARWDGQRTEEVPFFEGFYLLDAVGAAREKSMMDRLAREGDWPEAWWDPDWWPFAADVCGQLLVLEASSGEVIEFIHDDDPRPRHGETLEAFLGVYADELESGRRAMRRGYIVDVEEDEMQLVRDQERAAAQTQQSRRAIRTLLGFAALLLALIAMIFLWSRL